VAAAVATVIGTSVAVTASASLASSTVLPTGPSR
jgi:hypothetical protein